MRNSGSNIARMIHSTALRSEAVTIRYSLLAPEGSGDRRAVGRCRVRSSGQRTGASQFKAATLRFLGPKLSVKLLCCGLNALYCFALEKQLL